MTKTVSGVDYMADSLTPVSIKRKRKLDAEERLKKVSQEELPPVEVDPKTAIKPIPDPVFAEHLTLQERYDKEIT